MTFTGVKCDVCGRVKGETNRWFVLGRDGGFQGDGPLVIDRAERKQDDGELDLCGEACLVKKLSELLPGLHSEQAGAMGREI